MHAIKAICFYIRPIIDLFTGYEDNRNFFSHEIPTIYWHARYLGKTTNLPKATYKTLLYRCPWNTCTEILSQRNTNISHSEIKHLFHHLTSQYLCHRNEKYHYRPTTKNKFHLYVLNSIMALAFRSSKLNCS